MRLLLGAHAFLWFVTGDARLSRPARRAIEKADAELHLSAASVREMAIKSSLRRLRIQRGARTPDGLPVGNRRYLAAG